MNNNDLTVIVIGLLLTCNMILCWALGALQVSSGQRIAELTALAQRKPGTRRSGVVIPWPHIDYSDETAGDEA